MDRLFPENLRRKRWIYALRILCLAGALISFCFLFAQADAGLNPAKVQANDFGVNLYSSGPVLLQINVRFNQLNLLDCIKNRKTFLFNKLHISAFFVAFKHDLTLCNLSGFNSIVEGTFKLRYLLLDLPPPSSRFLLS
jgi:hypothetical protein